MESRPDLPASQIPSWDEQLHRIKRCGGHLKQFMVRYFCEPQTAEQYRQREALMSQIDSLEQKCNRLSRMLRSKQGIVQTFTADIKALYKDFGKLEHQVHAYRENYS